MTIDAFSAEYAHQTLYMTSGAVNVYKALHTASNVYHLIYEYTFATKEHLEEARARAIALQKLNSAYLNSLHTTFALSGSPSLRVAVDFYDHGSLAQVITNYTEQDTPIHENMVWEIVAQINGGLRSLHEQLSQSSSSVSLFHGNLRPSNVMITDNSKVVLDDYGFSTMDQALARPDQVDWQYSAPELLHGSGAGQCTPQSDMYSLGLIILEMCTRLPATQPQQAEAAAALERLQFPIAIEGYSKDLCELMQKLLQQDPSYRPTSAEVAEHRCVKDGHNRVVTNRHHNLEFVISSDDEVDPGTPRSKGSASSHSGTLMMSSTNDSDNQTPEVAHLLSLIKQDKLEELLVCQQFNNDCFAQLDRVTSYLKRPSVLQRLLIMAFTPKNEIIYTPRTNRPVLSMHLLQDEAISVIQECGYGAVILESLLLNSDLLDIPFSMLEQYVSEYKQRKYSWCVLFSIYNTVLISFNKLILAIISSPSRLPGLFNALRTNNMSRMRIWLDAIANPHVNEALRKLLLDRDLRRPLIDKQLDAFVAESDLITVLLQKLTSTELCSDASFAEAEAAAHILVQVLTAKVPFISTRVLSGIEPVLNCILSPQMNVSEACPKLTILMDFIVCAASFIICESTVICLRNQSNISDTFARTQSTLGNNDLLSCIKAEDRERMELFLRLFIVIKDIFRPIDMLLTSVSNLTLHYMWIDFIARLLQITEDVRTAVYVHRNSSMPSDGIDCANFNMPYAYGLKPIGYGMLLAPTAGSRARVSETQNTVCLAETFVLDPNIVLLVSVYTLCLELISTDLLYTLGRIAATNTAFNTYHIRFFKVLGVLFEYGCVDFQVLNGTLKSSRLLGFYETTAKQYTAEMRRAREQSKMHSSFTCHMVSFLHQSIKLAVVGTQYVQTEDVSSREIPTCIAHLKDYLSEEHKLPATTNKLGQILISSAFLEHFNSSFLLEADRGEKISPRNSLSAQRDKYLR